MKFRKTEKIYNKDFKRKNQLKNLKNNLKKHHQSK